MGTAEADDTEMILDASAPKAGVACMVCEYAMNELEKVISDKSTEAEVIAAVEQVCNLLPASYAAKCDALVEQYGNEIIELLIHAADPSTVCTLIGLCSSTQKEDEEESQIIMEQADDGDCKDENQWCKYHVMRGGCTISDWVKKVCRRTCNLC